MKYIIKQKNRVECISRNGDYHEVGNKRVGSLLPLNSEYLNFSMYYN